MGKERDIANSQQGNKIFQEQFHCLQKEKKTGKLSCFGKF